MAISFTAALLCNLAGRFHDKKWWTKYKFLIPYIPLFWVRLFFFLRDDSMDESIWTVNHRYFFLWCLGTAQFLLSAVNHRYLIQCIWIQHSYTTIITKPYVLNKLSLTLQESVLTKLCYITHASETMRPAWETFYITELMY